MVRFLKSRLQA